MTLEERLHQYGLLIRWHSPKVILLLLWPVLTALLIATAGRPSASLVFIFVSGVFVMRAAGDIINDIIDMKFDRHVARTKNRPLTSGTVKIWEAVILLIVLLCIALILVLFLNGYCFVLACIGIVLTIIYPFMKRFIKLPQGVLGIVWNLGIPIAFAASHNSVPFIGWFLFIIAIIWTIAYDTFYAMCDRADDEKLGLQSSAIWFASYDRIITANLQAVVLIGLFILGLLLKTNVWFYLAIIAVFFSFLYQQWLIKDRNPQQCLAAFSNNHWSWFFVFFGTFLNFLR